MISDVEDLVICPLAICLPSGRMSIQVFCPFFNWVVCFLDIEFYELFMLDVHLLLVIAFANIFFYLVGCLFVLLIVSFSGQKFFKFNLEPFDYFWFYFFCFRGQSQKLLL